MTGDDHPGPDPTTAPTTVRAGNTDLALLQGEISRALYEDAVGTVLGMQDDVDPAYSMRQFIEEAITSAARELETAYHHGQPWPAAERVNRRGINRAGRAAGDVSSLQSWIDAHIRSRCYGTVNGMKQIQRSYTLRDFLEPAVSQHITHLKDTHNRRWLPQPRLRRGRRG